MLKQPLALILTDTHLKAENILFIKDIYQQFIATAKKLGISKLIFMGDFFNSRASQGLDCLLAAFDIFHLFEEENLVIEAIAGNHDRASLTSPISYLSVFRKFKSVNVREEEFFEYDIENKIVYCYLSYFKEGICYLSRLVNLIDMIKSDKKITHYKKVLFTHISVNGTRNNDGSLVEGDMELSYFDFFDLILQGHYHQRQSLSKSVIYTGAAYQANYGETQEDKGFTVLYNDLSLKYIKSKFPAYKKLYIDASDKKQAAELIEEYAGNGDNVRMIFQGTQTELQSIDRVKLNDLGIDVKMEDVQNEPMFENIEEAEIVRFDKSSIARYWKTYAADNNISPEQTTKGFKMLIISK